MKTNQIRINYVKRGIPKRGPFDSDDYNSCTQEASIDFTSIANGWNNELFPLIDSLPKGTEETRWAGATLSEVPDPFIDGLDGEHIFADNAATISKDNGLFWDSIKNRPKSIRESDLDLSNRIVTLQDDLSTQIQNVSNGLSTDQWTRIGAWAKDGIGPSLPTSIDYIARNAQTTVGTLLDDIFVNYASALKGLGTLNTSGFTVEVMLSKLLLIHGVNTGTTSGWNVDPSGASHSTITGVLQTSVNASASYVKKARGGSPDAANLQEDLNRIRYEVARIKYGTTTTVATGQWNDDLTDPVDANPSCLKTHIEFQGNGTVGIYNPHATHRQDVTGLDTELGFMRTYSGKTALGSENPVYASTYYVSGSLVTAIGALDTEAYSHVSNVSNPHAVTLEQARTVGNQVSGDIDMQSYELLNLNTNPLSGSAVSRDWVETYVTTNVSIKDQYLFTGHTDINTPIRWTHNRGIGYPLIQLVDQGVGSDYGAMVDENYAYELAHGIISSTAFVAVEYIDANSVDIYTDVVNGVIIGIF